MAQQKGLMAPPLSQLRIAIFAAEDMNTWNIMECQLKIAAWAAENMNTFNIMAYPALTIDKIHKDTRKRKYLQLDIDELAEETGKPERWVEPRDNMTTKCFIKLQKRISEQE